MDHVTVGRRVVVYARVSQARGESKSIPEQLAELRRDVDRQGWPIIAEHTDEVSASAYSTKERSGWSAVMDVIASGDVDTLAVWEISRASRDRPVFAALLAACMTADVKVFTGGRLHDPADPDDGFMLDLGGALAVRESAMTSKRTRRSVEARAADGRPHGSLPYGYRRVLDPVTGRAVGRDVDAVQGPIVAEIVRRLLAREPANAIAEDLNLRQVPTSTGRQWRSGNMSKLALRPTYAGLRVHHGRVLSNVRGTWPPIITEAEHHRLVAMFADPDRDRFRNSTHVRHLGTGLYRCGREGCDGRMRVVAQVDRPNRYDCRVCHKISRHQDPVDRLVEQLLIRRLSAEDVTAFLSTMDTDPDAEAAASEAVALHAELTGLYDDVAAGRLSRAALVRMEPKYIERVEDAEQRARPQWLPMAVYDVAGGDAAERWEAASVADRRAILAALVDVTILPAGRGSWVFDPDLIQVRWKGGSG